MNPREAERRAAYSRRTRFYLLLDQFRGYAIDLERFGLSETREKFGQARRELEELFDEVNGETVDWRTPAEVEHEPA